MRKRIQYLLLMVVAASCACAQEQSVHLNVGFSPYLFSDVKKSDAAASIKVWIDTLVTNPDIRVGEDPAFFESTQDMKQALLDGKVDMVALLSDEFVLIEAQVKLEHIHFIALDGRISEEYLLLVRRDAEMENLADLQGKTITLTKGTKMQMGNLWLETRLMQQGAAGISSYFKSTEDHPKPSRAVMSVFFGKTDVCLVNRAGFETMVEMNPQIGKTLKVVETSPELVPSLVCLRATADPLLKKRMVHGFRNLHTSTRGAQILTVFKSDKLVAGSLEDLVLTRKWVEEYTRLKKQAAPEVARQTGGLK